ncbi:MAG: DUF1501 domain-containing protein, partial [Hyphomicrobiaceae bacterium]
MTRNRDQLLLPNRRHVLGGLSASLALWGAVPRAMARGRDPRLLVVILRGALDGLATVAPTGDPAYQRLHGVQTIPVNGNGAGFPLDGFFTLHPALANVYKLYLRKEALFAHAIATPYRGRSHFDGQDVLESGLGGKSRAETGWLNRAVGTLRADGAAGVQGLTAGAVVPLIMRGTAPVLSWIPKATRAPLHADTASRLANLYAETDPALAAAREKGLEIDNVAGTTTAGQALAAQQFRGVVTTAQAAARLLKADNGPRIGTLSIDGWDTHANEGVLKGRLNTHLLGLDAAIAALVEELGPAWKETSVLVVTEFGRTARVNGTSGTDHGTATVAILLGGGVRGGRVLADWPGLADAQLHEGRDLK